jgi:hypothetical protein
MLGAERQQGKRLAPAGRTFATIDQRNAEKALADQAETAYQRLMADWQPAQKTEGASVTTGRASQKPSKGKAARQTQ